MLSPAYDLVNSTLVIKSEKDEMALNVNARKRNLYKKGFDRLAENLGLPEKPAHKVYETLAKNKEEAMWWIDNSFLPSAQKNEFKKLLNERIKLFSQ